MTTQDATLKLVQNLRFPTRLELSSIIGAYLLYCLTWRFIYRPLTSPLRPIPAPAGGWGPTGHYGDIIDMYNHERTDSWIAQLGKTFRVRGMFWVHHRIWTIDPRAITHIMSKPYEYRKPAILRRALMRYMKEGLIPAEGERHKVQRKVVQKLFSGSSLRVYAGLIQEKADQLRDIVSDLLANPSHTAPYCSIPGQQVEAISGGEAGVRELDVYQAASRALFDLIGEIGIGHKFNSTDDWDGEGGRIFHEYDWMQQLVPGAAGLRFELSVLLPWLDRWFPTENSKRVEHAMGHMDRLSKKRIEEVRAEIAEDKKNDSKGYTDLLTLMVQSTNAPNVPTDQKMYEHEITGQLATFMFAGTDTTAGIIAFGLRLLALYPESQTKLRTECLSYGESLPFEQLDTLVYLAAVVREMIRMLPSIPSTIREASEDDIIPLSEPITLPSGETLTSIRIRAGQIVHIPIENLNMAVSVWGADARVFRPERWIRSTFSSDRQSAGADEGAGSGAGEGAGAGARAGEEGEEKLYTGTPPEVGEGPGVWNNMMTFIDGPRRCVGYRLGLMEMKILLYTLIREFEFGSVPGKNVYKVNMISTRPYVGGKLLEEGYQLPLLVKAYKGDR